MSCFLLILTIIAVPAVAQPGKIFLQTPGNGETASSICTFRWTKDTYSTSYQIEVDTDSTFSDPWRNDLTLTELTVSLSKAQRYFWKVRGVKDGTFGAWSDVWELLTLPPTPDAPRILAPLTNRDNLPVTFTVVWDSAEYAESYRLFVRKNGYIVIGADDLTGYTYQVTGLDSATTYQLLIQGKNQAGYGTASAMVFTTVGVISLPSPVELIYPADSSNPPIENSMPPFVITLQWKSQNPIKSYHLQVAGDPEFDSIVWNDSMLFTAEEYFSPDYKQCYWWRVRANNTAGWGEWSNVRSFCSFGNGSVQESDSENELLLIPNPAQNTVCVTFFHEPGVTTQLTITDALGRTVHADNITAYAGPNSLNIDLSNIPNGVYFFRLGYMQKVFRLLVDR